MEGQDFHPAATLATRRSSHTAASADMPLLFELHIYLICARTNAASGTYLDG